MFKSALIVSANPCPNCGSELQAVRDSTDKVCLKDENVKFDCPSCKYRFTYMPSLETPEPRYEGGKSLFCEVCDRHFASSSALKRHSLVHLPDRPFCCDECDKTFKTKAALKRHWVIHTGELPYECSTCKRKFNQISNLRKHLVIHSKNCPFYCKICGKGFNQLSNMKKHFSVHNRESRGEAEVIQNTKKMEAKKEPSPPPEERIKTVARPVLTFVKPAIRSFPRIFFNE